MDALDLSATCYAGQEKGGLPGATASSQLQLAKRNSGMTTIQVIHKVLLKMHALPSILEILNPFSEINKAWSKASSLPQKFLVSTLKSMPELALVSHHHCCSLWKERDEKMMRYLLLLSYSRRRKREMRWGWAATRVTWELIPNDEDQDSPERNMISPLSEDSDICGPFRGAC